jgi:hypothetical protein
MEQIENFRKLLKAQSKQIIFQLYCQTCLPRIHSAKCSEMNKSWMIQDIIESKFGHLKTV